MSLREELALVSKLKKLGLTVNNFFGGDTYRSDRIPKARSLIVSNGLADTLFAEIDGRKILMRHQFWLAYGEDLDDATG